VIEVAEELLRILKTMNAITSNIGWKEFTKKVGLSPSQTVHGLQELLKAGFVRKIGQGYSLTEKGKIALNVLDRVPKDMEFHFYTGIGQDTGLSAKSLQDFYKLVKKVDVAALEFHISRGHFENWIKTVFHDTQLLNEFVRIRKLNLKGENLRNEIVKATKRKYCKFQESFRIS